MQIQTTWYCYAKIAEKMHMSRNATYSTMSIGAHVFYIKLNKPINLGMVIEHKLT